MQLLLDTHIALWAITNSPHLSPKARNLILAPENTITVSTVTLWEIAIKHALKRENMPISAQQALAYFHQAGYIMLNVIPEHILMLEHLKPIHTDLFDRLLVAQALAQPLRLATHDKLVSQYSDTIIEV